MTGRSRLRTVLCATVSFGAVVGLTVALAQQTAGSTFTSSSGSAGNKVTAAAQFCSGTGTATVGTNTTVVDTWLDQNSPSNGGGGSKDLYVRSLNGGNTHVLVRFALPTVPAGCSVTSATLRLWAMATTPGRTIGAYRVDPGLPQWDEYLVAWNNQPSVTADPPATSASVAAGNWQQWTVTDIVRAQYTNGNNGFLLRDQAPDNVSQIDNRYRSREDGLPPELTVNWG